MSTPEPPQPHQPLGADSAHATGAGSATRPQAPRLAARKPLIAAVLLALAAVAAVAGVRNHVGSQTEQAMRDFITRANASRNGPVLALRSHERGMSSSHGVLSVDMNRVVAASAARSAAGTAAGNPAGNAEGEAAPLRPLLVAFEVQHGPLLSGPGTAAVVDYRPIGLLGRDGATEAMPDWMKQMNAQARSVIGFDGKVHSTGGMQGGEHASDAQRLSWKPLSFEADTVNDSPNDMALRVDWGGFNLKAEGAAAGAVANVDAEEARKPFRLDVGALRLEGRSDSRGSGDARWFNAVARTTGSVDSVALTTGSDARPVFELQKVDVSSDGESRDGVQTGKGSATARGRIGELALDSIKSSFALHGLNVKQLIESELRLRNAAPAPADPQAGLAQQRERSAARLDALLGIVDSGAKMDSTLDLVIQGKPGSIGYNLVLEPRKDPAPAGRGAQLAALGEDSTAQVAMQTAAELLPRLALDVKASIPRDWVTALQAALGDAQGSAANLAQTVDSLVAQGLVRAEGDGLRADLQLARGALALNGRPLFNLGSMLGAMPAPGRAVPGRPMPGRAVPGGAGQLR